MSDTLAGAITTGIERGLADVGADLTGCTASTLSGWVIRELRTAGWVPDYAAAAWDEGHEAGRVNEREWRSWRRMTNPYRDGNVPTWRYPTCPHCDDDAPEVPRD